MTAGRIARIAAEVVTPPGDYGGLLDRPSVFLAGAIDMGEAEDWQSKVVERLDDLDVTVLNPRREDWDSTWKQSVSDPRFVGQVKWELSGLDAADVVAVGLPKGSKAPISLMELGLHARGGKAVVWCPEGFWRKGNVDVVCARYGVPVLEDFGEFVAEVERRLRAVRISAKVVAAEARRVTQLELMRSVRKPMPPPTSRHERKDRPSRQEEKRRLRQEYQGGRHEQA